jgi:release factor glutamine methyltransferase
LDEARVEPALKRLEAGEPLPYVLGRWEFFGLEFDLTPDVLIPRPETELLVEKSLAWLKATPEQCHVADIGTGSGAIAVAIAKHAPNARILATDISHTALEVAKSNAEKHEVQHQIEFVECDLLPTLNVERLPFNVLCSNPPYIPSQALRRLPIFGREPTLALDGGADGLVVYRHIFQIAPRWLTSQGMMLLEIEATLGEAVTQLARDSFPHAKVQLHRDLAGRDRLVQINLIN